MNAGPLCMFSLTRMCNQDCRHNAKQIEASGVGAGEARMSDLDPRRASGHVRCRPRKAIPISLHERRQRRARSDKEAPDAWAVPSHARMSFHLLVTLCSQLTICRDIKGETENQVLAFAGEHKDDVDACVVKPGLITDSTTAWRSVVATVVHSGVSPIAGISTTAVVAAMLDQVIHGFEKESLMNDELVSIGAKVLQEQSESEAKKESSEEVGA